MLGAEVVDFTLDSIRLLGEQPIRLTANRLNRRIKRQISRQRLHGETLDHLNFLSQLVGRKRENLLASRIRESAQA